MKKRLLALVLCLVLCAALTVPALAANPQMSDYVSSESCAALTCAWDTVGRPTGYTVRYTDTSAPLTSDGQYILMVIKVNDLDHPETRTISESTIMFIDQYTGSQLTDGVTFMPRSIPNSIVLLGGDFAGSPIKLGEIVGQGVSVSGKVTSLGSAPAAVTIYDESKNVVSTPVTTNASGEFTISSVPAGSYAVEAVKNGHVGAPIRITVGDDDYTAANITLFGGDADASKQVDAPDLTGLLKDFNKTSGFSLPYSDLDGDGGVTAADLSPVLVNFNRKTVEIKDFSVTGG